MARKESDIATLLGASSRVKKERSATPRRVKENAKREKLWRAGLSKGVKRAVQKVDSSDCITPTDYPKEATKE